MAGLARICKMYGRMKVGSITWVWDYATDTPVHETDMPIGSERWKASEAKRAALIEGEQP
ncbi:hypothetical protein A3728_18365 [Sulfitobacter sp. HI0040]|nr:hypothetical protein A3728_18365 [Sulfitobacter sp. HI0040]KZZ66530.1 hypothetical protein A3764_16825 [Sulfitobacter sp. HI0129]